MFQTKVADLLCLKTEVGSKQGQDIRKRKSDSKIPCESSSYVVVIQFLSGVVPLAEMAGFIPF